jgi:hypothetical protein
MVPPSSFPPQVRCLSLCVPAALSSQTFLSRRSFLHAGILFLQSFREFTRRVGVQAAVGKQLEDAVQDLLCSLSLAPMNGSW